jgi:hypothetical protein
MRRPRAAAEIAGGEVFTGEEIGEVAGEFIGGAGLGVSAGVVGTEVGMVGKRGVRHWRPSAKVKRHKDLQSCGRGEDIVVAPKIELEIKKSRRKRDAILTKKIVSE